MKSRLVKKLLPYFVILIGIAYGIWPIDILPDVPVVGWFDDLGVIGSAIYIAVKMFSRQKKTDNKDVE